MSRASTVVVQRPRTHNVQHEREGEREREIALKGDAIRIEQCSLANADDVRRVALVERSAAVKHKRKAWRPIQQIDGGTLASSIELGENGAICGYVSRGSDDYH